VIVVNDDPVQRRLASAILKKDGLEVISCDSASHALQIMSESDPPDVIITDLYMPGIDGWRFCRLLRSPEYANLNNVPILVTSATFSGPDAQQVVDDLGANAFLPAPYESSRLRASVQAMLSGGASHSLTHVLIVEDCSGVTVTLMRAFEAHGYRVHTARTGEEGRRVFQEYSPEIVILDYHLPDGVSDALLKEFKRPKSFSVVVVITADPTPDLATRLMHIGADAYVRKPFDFEYVIDLCEKARREHAMLRIEDILNERSWMLQDALARTEEQHAALNAIFEAVPIGMLAVEENLTIAKANKVAGKMVKRSRDDILGKVLGEGLGCRESGSGPRGCGSGEACKKCPLRRAVVHTLSSGKATEDIEITPTFGPNGKDTETYWRLDIVRVTLNGGAHAVITLEDVTQQKQVEQERLRREKLHGVIEMAGAACHELSQPMQVISGYIDLLAMQLSERDPGYEEVQKMGEQVERIAEITGKLNRITRYEARDYVDGTRIVDIDKASEDEDK